MNKTLYLLLLTSCLFTSLAASAATKRAPERKVAFRSTELFSSERLRSPVPTAGILSIKFSAAPQGSSASWTYLGPIRLEKQSQLPLAFKR